MISFLTLLTLKCSLCAFVAEFPADNRSGARADAKAAGWLLGRLVQACPDCFADAKEETRSAS